MSWFEGQVAKEKKCAVMNVVAVMLADGKIDPAEMKFLGTVCKRVGLSEEDMKGILKDPGSVKFAVPEGRKERVNQLIDMVFMMLADGKIDKHEMDLCTMFAARLGFNPSVVPKLVQDIVGKIQKGISRPVQRRCRNIPKKVAYVLDWLTSQVWFQNGSYPLLIFS